MRLCEVVVVGASRGGLQALEVLLAGLPSDFAVPMAVVQHRTKQARETLSELLGKHSPLPVSEAEDKEELRPGRIYLAPPDYHLLVEAKSLALSTDPRVCHARPSIDVLFESAAASYAESVIGVLLTGASQDGSEGLLSIKSQGGTTLVQDPATAESPIMPQAAIDAGGADHVLPVSEMPAFLGGRCHGTASHLASRPSGGTSPDGGSRTP